MSPAGGHLAAPCSAALKSSSPQTSSAPFRWTSRFEGVGALGLLVVIRTILSFSIDVEINGVAPWRARTTNSGG